MSSDPPTTDGNLSQIRSAPAHLYSRTLSHATTGLDRSKSTPENLLQPAHSTAFIEFNGTGRYLYPSAPHDEDVYAEARSDSATDSSLEEEKSEADIERNLQNWPTQTLERLKSTRSKKTDPFLVCLPSL
jgi:hypothetical protein